MEHYFATFCNGEFIKYLQIVCLVDNFVLNLNCF